VRVIGVLDLLGGRAVHAQAGHRDRYAPVRALGGEPTEPGNTMALARGYLDRLKLTELYAADLDAILGRGSQDALATQLAALGVRLWLDAGVRSPAAAHHALALGAARVVVGLETLSSFEVLREICEEVGSTRIAFSLDLRDGEPIIAPSADDHLRREPAHRVASRAADAGVGAIIVIDLARVGTYRGLDLERIAKVRAATGALTLVAGGGVRGLDDLTRLNSAGCDGALVATALHDGRLDAEQLAAAEGLRRPRN
jgi:phosphoribosylformimino-5-aminoimidazole carboxamide ribotide isomerase